MTSLAQKQPVLAKPGLGQFQRSPAHNIENDAKKRQSTRLAPGITDENRGAIRMISRTAETCRSSIASGEPGPVGVDAG